MTPKQEARENGQRGDYPGRAQWRKPGVSEKV
jgi:hypothetical protein